MNTLPDQLLKEFTSFHDRLTAQWENADATTDTAPMEAACHATYHGTFGGPGMDEVAPFNRADGLEGFRNAIKAGNHARIENRTIRMRSSTEAVVFFERIFHKVKGGEPVARLFTVEYWRLIDGEWKLMRETVEQVAV